MSDDGIHSRLDEMTKAELVQHIADRIGTPPPPMSSGSTEPRQIFELIVSELGLPVDTKRLTKPELAGAICRVADVNWDESTCESSGGTVTKIGLAKVADSVELLLGGQ